ncbi:hypothetical protein P4H71_04245 [Paenibacillus kribbensis]|uniref:hypothetical protein n=1 Tax=Paenibacillus kribbensis TaxID=172713 RepID=UPI002DB6325F|nr:hypothetical protein [Paenibacillus kribbensis]MEC0233565.1 hypothetical protein [Paenibacillus kribbensis]
MEGSTLKNIPGYYPYRIDEEGKVYVPHSKTGFPVQVKEHNGMVNVRQDGRPKKVKVSELYRRAFNKLLPED